MVSDDCCVVLPCDALALYAVCDCGISLSYSLTIFPGYIHLFLFENASQLPYLEVPS